MNRVGFALVLLSAFVPDVRGASTTRVSLAKNGGDPDDVSVQASVSSNGRFVAFQSFASNLVAGDANGQPDAFVTDRKTGVTVRASVDPIGVEANGPSFVPSISGDGRFVAFLSEATNLVPGDTNGKTDVFLHDKKTGATTRVSVDSAGNQSNSGATSPAISANGRFVTFISSAADLVAGDTNVAADVFVHDRKTGVTTRVSVDSAGIEANGGSSKPSISANGRFVAFTSLASNLVVGDGNGKSDVFLHDLTSGETTIVSIDSDGNAADDDSNDSSISANGRFIAFTSSATNLVPLDSNVEQDVFVHDRKTGSTTRVSVNSGGIEANDTNFAPAISGNGRFVAFHSVATNYVDDDVNGSIADVFEHDRKHGKTTLASASGAGVQVDVDAHGAKVSKNGRFVVFDTAATTLSANDQNNVGDVYLHDRKK